MKEKQQDFRALTKKRDQESRKSKKLEERQQAERYHLPAVFAIV